jgi:hypothetical protein
LKRLVNLVMSDVQGLLDEVFMEEWLEGQQMQSVTATILDYMNDFVFSKILVGKIRVYSSRRNYDQLHNFTVVSKEKTRYENLHDHCDRRRTRGTNPAENWFIFFHFQHSTANDYENGDFYENRSISSAGR